MASRTEPLTEGQVVALGLVLIHRGYWCAQVDGALRLFKAPEAADHIYERQLVDGRWLFADFLCFGRVQIALSSDPATLSYEESWIYEDVSQGLQTAVNWNGEGDPEGWVRWTNGREPARRRPGGDAAKEFRAP